MRVVAAMSGGVDSAVAAARMLDAGHDVVGVHLALSQSAATLRESARGCCTIEDAGDARRVADVLGIPTDPELVATPPVEMPANPPSQPAPATPAAGGAPSEPVALDRPGSDGVVPADQVTGIDGATTPREEPPNTADTTEAEPPPARPDAGVDAGTPPPDEDVEPAVDAGVASTAPDECQGDLGRVPVDVVLIVDNTATMATPRSCRGARASRCHS